MGEHKKRFNIKAGKRMNNKYKEAIPKKDVEYTFLQPDGRTYNAYTLIGMLPNGRYEFSGRTITGPNKASRWITTMTPSHFSYNYAKRRSLFYPDTELKSPDQIHIQEEKFNREQADELKRIEESRKFDEKCKIVSSMLFNMSEEKRRECAMFNLNVLELSKAVLGEETDHYSSKGSAIGKIVRDLDVVSRITGLKVSLV